MSPLFRLTLIAGLLSLSPVHAAPPFQSATITRLENHVSIGREGREERRPAAVADQIKAKDYVLTATDSRAELEFPDRSLVRIGQNAVFSFESESRTFSLEKGSMLFYITPGNGGKIKTPSLTASVEGSVAKVLPHLIAVISGRLITPWGIVEAGNAIENVGGRIRIYRFNPQEAGTGKLYAWGPLPEIPQVPFNRMNPLSRLPDLHWLDTQELTVANPRVNKGTPTPTPSPRQQERNDSPRPAVSGTGPGTGPGPTPTPFPF